MLQKISCAIEKRFELFGLVNDENREIYLFSSHQLLMLLINLIRMNEKYEIDSSTLCKLYYAFMSQGRYSSTSSLNSVRINVQIQFDNAQNSENTYTITVIASDILNSCVQVGDEYYFEFVKYRIQHY